MGTFDITKSDRKMGKTTLVHCTVQCLSALKIDTLVYSVGAWGELKGIIQQENINFETKAKYKQNG